METLGRRLSTTLLATMFVATTATACVIMPPTGTGATTPAPTGTSQPQATDPPTETTEPSGNPQAQNQPTEEECTEALFQVVGGGLAEGSTPRPGEFDVPGLQDVVVLDCQHSFDIPDGVDTGNLDWDAASIGVLHNPEPGANEEIDEWFTSSGWTERSQVTGTSFVKEDTTVNEPGEDPAFNYGEAVEIYELADLAQPEQIASYEETTGATLADDALAIIYVKGYVVADQ